jgi:hypothetical protein
MNEQDPFEQRLRRQPMRQLPSAWRQGILTAAEANRPERVAQPASEDQAALIAGWRLLFGRLPLAWASLAALWIALVGVNLTLSSPMVGAAVSAPASVRMVDFAALTTELDSAQDPLATPPKASPAGKPSDVPQRPRSERRRVLNFGAADSDFRFDFLG